MVMLLKDKIIEEWKEAYKNKNENLKSAFAMVKAKILIEEKSGKHELPLSDEIVVSLVNKEVKELKETQTFYKPEDQMYQDINEKIEALSTYLPKQLTEEEVKAIIIKLKETENNMGKLIGLTVKEVGNRFDKSQISKLVKEVING